MMLIVSRCGAELRTETGRAPKKFKQADKETVKPTGSGRYGNPSARSKAAYGSPPNTEKISRVSFLGKSTFM